MRYLGHIWGIFGSVLSHGAHGVAPKAEGASTRWCSLFCYRKEDPRVPPPLIGVPPRWVRKAQEYAQRPVSSLLSPEMDANTSSDCVAVTVGGGCRVYLRSFCSGGAGRRGRAIGSGRRSGTGSRCTRRRGGGRQRASRGAPSCRSTGGDARGDGCAGDTIDGSGPEV